MNSLNDNNLNIALKNFTPHGLEDLDKANLMNRIDSKFIFCKAQLVEILSSLNERYTMLEINDQRLFQYDNTYYDTNDLRYYRLHHNGKLNRHKIRYRNYVDSGSAYLEVKFKNNKNRTEKNRIKVNSSPLEAIKQSQGFLAQCGISKPAYLQIAQKSGYKRISLANEKNAERLTMDMGLHFLDVKSGSMAELGKYVIAELKQDKLNRESPFYKLMREKFHRPTSFSKYCMGMYFTSKADIKTNRFKSIAIDMLRN